jgi:hypothetical protein
MTQNIFVISIILSLCPLAIVIGGLITRYGKGIGWQFIRYIVIGISIPIAAILSLNNAFDSEISILIAGALSYCFAKNDKSI